MLLFVGYLCGYLELPYSLHHKDGSSEKHTYLDIQCIHASIMRATQYEAGTGVCTRGSTYGTTCHVPPYHMPCVCAQYIHTAVIATCTKYIRTAVIATCTNTHTLLSYSNLHKVHIHCCHSNLHKVHIHCCHSNLHIAQTGCCHNNLRTGRRMLL